jgi:hypothetical protein
LRNIHSSAALDGLAELLGTVVLVQEVVGDLLQISKMAVQQRRADGKEVGMAGVIDLDDTPGVLASADLAAADLDDVLGADDREGHQSPELCVLLDGVLVIFLNVVGEVVDGDPVVLDILHDQLLGLGELVRGQGIGTTNDGDDVDARSQALHQLNVELAKTGMSLVHEELRG